MSAEAEDHAPPPSGQRSTATFPPGDVAARLIDEGRAAERLGQREEARARFEAALHQLRDSAASSQAAAVIRWIARTYMTDGDHEAAMDCAEAALAVAQASDDRAGEGHAINVQAAIRWAQGDLDAAETLYRVARTYALEADERALVAMTSANLGIIANIRGDFAEALHHYSAGLENYRALDRRSDVVVALNNLGRLHTDLRQWSEAERAYAEAIDISNAIGDQTARIGLEVNVADMRLAGGDTARAAVALDNAVRLATETGDTAWAAHIAKLRGMLHQAAGAITEAEQHFDRAVELSESRQDLLLLAETLLERAQLYRSEGRNQETLQNLNRAHRLFTQLRAKRELANVDRSVARLEDDFMNVVRKWGESIEAKDRYTQGHCVRVADLSCAIGSACGIEGQSLFWFRIGALLHDVGKLVVPSEILNKPGKLTDEEWVLMRSHPTAGVDMLAGIDFPWDVRPVIESHHERWDGKGYPHGLRGDDIPLSARILSIADVYDALTSLRSYKASLSHEAALDIMRRDVGSAFDAAVFTKFEDVIRGGSVPAFTFPAARTSHDAESSRPSLDLTVPDRLTGLPPRPSMERITAQALADRQVTNGVVSLLVLEVHPNAAWSDVHRRRVLRWVANELRQVTRTSDFVARTGDHQFMALLPDASRRQARSIMARVHSALTRRLQSRPNRSTVQPIQMVVLTAPEDGRTAGELFDRAERAGAQTAGDRANRAS